ncbi:MAG: BMC domain-containing protein [Phycisphaerales bacterium]|nr:BMC domain-containing protein [Phycisphaerales bacterium]
MAQQAIGMIETKGLIAAVEAADAALKAANVQYVGQHRVGNGLVAITFTGDVSAIKAAIEAGSAAGGKLGQIVSTSVIARPHEDTTKL